MKDQRWQPRQTVGALDVYTRKILVHLELTCLSVTGRAGVGGFKNIDFEKGEPFIGSLCAFKVLERIRMEMMMLYKEIEGANS